ncbi:hypothetical protein JQ634_34310 [Bradyrhizobium sp. AUGA SZCCT0240]|uniref:hypothetical protein n=1 Tax=unclassified Bradyrhizobium TaxID=2631580 RepID=UPI001BAD794F|nr:MULTISPECIES: hypothetical protein [unclassified Bradyrhizobium]MBR1193883.1 hypothetical protein [Bradyrhizobium sp. AUGA SZCCT0160]MBR1200804.1 hypothetical protein [Bradyrhizobium sp. AUGA SZCCT0158]MBR1245139.1 hypothetical protein [Bradyrhizobium sp. AUGA SZCCT0274]MBR1258726.1 hypothetical protein [Bradyrhizobium sp. AUGA SZCCT0240]
MSSSEKTAVEVPMPPSGQRREQVIVGVAFFVPVVLAMAGWLYLLSKLIATIYVWLFQ